jgi:transporter family-2 protein
VSWLAWSFALVSGALITCQVGSNTQLKKSLGQPLPALLVNYLLGISAVFFYAVFRVGWAGFSGLSTAWWRFFLAASLGQQL